MEEISTYELRRMMGYYVDQVQSRRAIYRITRYGRVVGYFVSASGWERVCPGGDPAARRDPGAADVPQP